MSISDTKYRIVLSFEREGRKCYQGRKERASTILVKFFFYYFYFYLFKGMVCFVVHYIDLYIFISLVVHNTFFF